jgi:hypothetical protein
MGTGMIRIAKHDSPKPELEMLKGLGGPLHHLPLALHFSNTTSTAGSDWDGVGNIYDDYQYLNRSITFLVQFNTCCVFLPQSFNFDTAEYNIQYTICSGMHKAGQKSTVKGIVNAM